MILGIESWLFWLILAMLALIIEVSTALMVSVWFVLGGLAACVAALVGASLTVQWLVFSAVTLLTLLLTWKKRAEILLTSRKTATNADRILNHKGEVTETIDPVAGSGKVLVAGQVWSARTEQSNTIPEGAEVRILRIEGVKAIVVPWTDE